MAEQDLHRVAVVPVVEAACAHLIVAYFSAIAGVLRKHQRLYHEGEQHMVYGQSSQPRCRDDQQGPIVDAGCPKRTGCQNLGMRKAPGKKCIHINAVGGKVAPPHRSQMHVPREGHHESAPCCKEGKGLPSHARGKEEGQATGQWLHHKAHVVVAKAHAQGFHGLFSLTCFQVRGEASAMPKAQEGNGGDCRPHKALQREE
mmetsp:Transcript_37690/g.59529  ORF Transcript_37690/g.59529 Transcript_37690/m.59529 type:complete len:201 (+) Transcript_37690:410-1012(+)